MKKYLSFLLFFSVCTNLHPNDASHLFSGGFTVGTLITGITNRAEEYITFGYFNAHFLADLGFSFNQFKYVGNPAKKDVGRFVGDLGLRKRLYENLFFTCGAIGSAEVVTYGRAEWSIGAFTGLDLQIVRHLLLNAKLCPFNYVHSWEPYTQYDFFGAGSVGLSYVF